MLIDDRTDLSNGVPYTPSALLQLYNTAMAPAATRNILLLKGIYQSGAGNNYNGMYYDRLKDEATDAVVTLIVPALVRKELAPGKTVEFYGYITKRVVTAGGRIEIHANITQLVAQTQNRYNEKEVRALAIQQEKVNRGYRDVDSAVKASIVRGERLRVMILVGRAAIIDSDILHAMEEAVGFYDLRFERIGMSSEAEIMDALDRHDHPETTDLLVLSRGGGENLDVFDSPVIAERCVNLQPLLLTAIGHKENIPLVQRVADKAFITPTALGQWLNAIYNDSIADIEHSKAKLVEGMTQQFKATYEKQVETLQQRIRDIEEMAGKNQGLLERTRELAEGYRLQAQRLDAEAGKARVMKWVIRLAVAVAAGVLGWFLGRH
ncbi:MAG: exodeoxyribonuclease VII large subunit [Bacteroidota bacterium]|nr:exodeoxyribonuclease VII large subunit [Bacteroidota bacterium]MDP4215573.1 exodeoxyribonuclease VII large subunit [Bacteroidota bacterium]MDP4245991.1 exodeoxyribonuclease VII large subunit [Bacteroidota bacterium]MDP4253830.1 exodeoxyribonuclease VII large subunit [Bacteroidota bacterium]MDP4257764.1 exodeoxyribonuclease VII large subunit [Bacteroidota bacterium]